MKKNNQNTPKSHKMQFYVKTKKKKKNSNKLLPRFHECV
jgi:hypothetical protein